jgi:ureidoacrylate peracid hydrolase
MKPALLVIDIQNWFFQIPSFLTSEGLGKVDNLVDNTNQLIRFFKDNNLPIIHILTVHSQDGSTRDLWGKQNNSKVLMEGSSDVEELPNIMKYDTDIQVIKTRTNSFLHTELDNLLKRLKIDTVVITGYSTNKCVGITSIEACERDYKVVLSGDAILGPQVNKVEAMELILKTYGIEPELNESIIEMIKSECIFKEAGGSV